MYFVHCSVVADVTNRKEHGLALGCLEDIIWSTKSGFFPLNYGDCINSLNRMIHGFTCAGMLPTQYIKLSRFAGIGTVKHGYISKGSQCLVVLLYISTCLV